MMEKIEANFDEVSQSQLPLVQMLINMGYTYLSREEVLRQRGENPSEFILKEIAKKEKIEVTEEEVSERIKQITQLRREAKIEKEPEDNGEIKGQLEQEKVFEFIKKRARIIWKPEKKIVLA